MIIGRIIGCTLVQTKVQLGACRSITYCYGKDAVLTFGNEVVRYVQGDRFGFRFWYNRTVNDDTFACISNRNASFVGEFCLEEEVFFTFKVLVNHGIRADQNFMITCCDTNRA